MFPLGGKIIVRKVIRNGQPEDGQADAKKEATKAAEAKLQKTAESAESAQKDKVKTKAMIRPKVRRT